MDRKPQTLGDVKSYGVDIFCYCNRCGHNSVVPVDLLIDQLGPAYEVPKVWRWLRCQECDSKDVQARPNWKGLGVVANHRWGD